MSRDEARRAGAIIAFALLARLGWGLGAGVTPGAGGFDDAAWYHWSAIGLTRGYGYVSPLSGQPSAAWPPGYPLVLAVAYAVFGADPAIAVVVNAVAGALTCVFVWRLGLRLVGPRGGLVAAALLAAFPSQIFFGALVLTETLFTCLVAALLLAAVRLLAEAPRVAPWLLWGVGTGLTALVRAESAVFALVPAATLARHGAGRAAGRVLVATVLGTLVALAPWTIRNARVFGALVPLTTSFGRTLWIGHNPDADGGMHEALQRTMEHTMAAAEIAPTGPAGELATNRMLLRAAITFALAHPVRELGLTAARVYHLFRGDHAWQAWYGPGTPRFLPSTSARQWLGRIGNVYYVTVAVLALIGCVLRGSEPAMAWRFLEITIVAWIGIFALIYGDPRFHHVLVPPACVLAAVTLTREPGGRPPRERGAATT